MSTLVLIPMKDLSLAKTRLEGRLSCGERRGLSLHLFRRTLAVLEAAQDREPFEIAVVTRCRRVANISAPHRVIGELKPGLNPALSYAAERAVVFGYNRLCILPGDLANPSPGDIVGLLRMNAEVIICPSEDRGTNAMVLPLPARFAMGYGQGSAARHADAARMAGYRPRVIPFRSLSHDIDSPDCLDRALAQVPELRPWATP